MVEFVDTEVEPSGKKKAEVFAAVRARGMLNAGLDVLAQAFEKAHKGFRCRWEFYNPGISGGTDLVTMREGMGFTAVTWDKMPDRTETSQVSGLVRRGDLILMAGPTDLVEEYERQDAEMARADLRLPETAFRDLLNQNRVTRPSDGVVDQAVGTGKIKIGTQEMVPRPDTIDAQGG